LAILILVVVVAYHTWSNRLANVINQFLALIKMTTLLVITIIGLVHLRQSNNGWDALFQRHKGDSLTANEVAVAMLLVSSPLREKGNLRVAI
jgi:hypothetical protein